MIGISKVIELITSQDHECIVTFHYRFGSLNRHCHSIHPEDYNLKELTTKEHEHVVAVDHPHRVKVGQHVGARDTSLTEERSDQVEISKHQLGPWGDLIKRSSK